MDHIRQFPPSFKGLQGEKKRGGVEDESMNVNHVLLNIIVTNGGKSLKQIGRSIGFLAGEWVTHVWCMSCTMRVIPALMR